MGGREYEQARGDKEGRWAERVFDGRRKAQPEAASKRPSQEESS